MSRGRTAGVVAALGVALAAACVRVPPADLARDPGELADQVRAAQARVQRVKGTARVRVQSPTLSGTVLEFLAAEKPDRLRLETLDFFGNPAAVLVASGGRFSFFDARANVFYRGEATPENVSRLLPVALPAEELVTILCGSAPLLPGRALEVGVEDGYVLLTIGAGDVGQRLALGPKASVAWSRLRRAGATGVDETPAYDLTFDRFEDRAGARFPTEVRLDAPAGRAVVELRWRPDLEVQGDLDAGLFRMEPPRGARVIELERGQTVPAADR